MYCDLIFYKSSFQIYIYFSRCIFIYDTYEHLQLIKKIVVHY